MSHKTEAEKWLAAAVSPETEKSPAGYAAAEMMTARAQVLATLALVDALEAANEQARIANLLSIRNLEGVDSEEVVQQIIRAARVPEEPRDLAVLGLRERTHAALWRAGIRTDREALQWAKDGRLSDIRNIGQRAIAEIERALGIGGDA